MAKGKKKAASDGGPPAAAVADDGPPDAAVADTAPVRGSPTTAQLLLLDMMDGDKDVQLAVLDAISKRNSGPAAVSPAAAPAPASSEAVAESRFKWAVRWIMRAGIFMLAAGAILFSLVAAMSVMSGILIIVLNVMKTNSAPAPAPATYTHARAEHARATTAPPSVAQDTYVPLVSIEDITDEDGAIDYGGLGVDA